MPVQQVLPAELDTTLSSSFTIEVTERCPEAGGQGMPLLQVIVTLIVVGILPWLVNRFIPMAPSIRSILNAVVVYIADSIGLLPRVLKYPV